jgi:hypothetical protein
MVVVRSYFRFAILIAVAFGLGCEGKAKKTPITKKGATVRAQNDKALDQMISEGKDCLPLKRVVDHFRSQEETVYSLSTYDVDIGQYVSSADKHGSAPFTSSSDAAFRSQVALFYATPRYVFATGKQMADSDVFEELLGLTSQEACKEFRVQGQFDDDSEKTFDHTFRILSHTATSLVARDIITEEVRTYYLTKNSELEITRYRADRNKICGKNLPPGQLIKETVVLSWGDSLQHVRMKRAYAQMIADQIQEPKELKEKLARGGTKPVEDKKSKERLQRPSSSDGLSMEFVSVSYPTYFFILKEIHQRKFENLTCN